MKFLSLCLTLGLAAGLAAQTAPASAPSSAPQNVTGTVTNATLGKPAAGIEVTLLQLQGGMQPVAKTDADSAGRYRFSQSTGGPFLVEVEQSGVPYFAPVATGQSETNVAVYDANPDEQQIVVDAEIVVVQPQNGQLAVVDEYRIENTSKVTFYRAGGLFRFRIPTGATIDGAHLEGPGGMPIEAQPKATAKPDVYSLDYPFRPGETKVQVAYRVPYPALKAAISDTPVYPTSHFEVYVPAAMTFDGPGFTQVGQQDGYRVFGIATGAMPATLAFNLAGDAPMPADAGGSADASGAAPAASAAPAPPPAGEVPAKTFMERNLWAIVSILAIAAAAGFGVLFSQPRSQPAGPPALPLPVLSPLPACLPADDDLKRLKDDLFLLEVRHHTGDLDAGEYQRLRAAIRARMDRLAGK